MPDDSSRNRPLEKMIESGAIPVGCQFKDCNFETAYPDIGRHEESCPHGKGQKVLTERDAAIPVTPATTPTAAATATAGGADVAVTVTRSQTSSSSAVDETDGHSIKVNISLTR